MIFSESQQLAYDAYLSGDNVMISGAAGTGKTTLIKSFYTSAIDSDKTIQVCAMTGCASLLLQCNATTLHSWSGLQIRLHGSDDTIAKRCLRKVGVFERWNKIDILVVDEISMMSKKMLHVLDIMGKKSRKNRKPFGGIQLIFSGDFYQLPPIGEDHDPDTKSFCFESPIWKNIFTHQVELTTIFRQKKSNFVKLLGQVRKGKISRKSYNLLLSCMHKDINVGDTRPIKIYPRKRMVNESNMNQLQELKTEEIKFEMKTLIEDESRVSQNEIDFFKNQLPCPEILSLKIGAQVMCIVNLDLDSALPICNGSCGIIVDISQKGVPVVKFNNGLIIPIDFYTWDSHDYNYKISQIPLILAWCISIHKSQGATLEKAEIDIGPGIFEHGQSYVALSRLKNIEGLYIKSVDPWGITANPIVTKYYDSITTKPKNIYTDKPQIPSNVLTKWLNCPSHTHTQNLPR
tara:strand:+ start:160 stop:1539 length:1380 start_codon:yes stop_codon:yes gene_type:complete